MRVRQKAQFELAKRGAKGADIFRKNIKQTNKPAGPGAWHLGHQPVGPPG